MTIHMRGGSPSPAADCPSAQPDPSWHATGAELAGLRVWSGSECVRTLYRRKASLAWIMSVGILAAALVSVAEPRLYQSQASLEIREANENFLNLRNVYPTTDASADSNGAYVQTQVEILQQDALIEQVARKLGLEGQEYHSSPSLWEKLRQVTGVDPASTSAAQRAVEVVKQNLKIVSSRGSRIIRIVCDARDSQLAADVANTLAQTFIEQGIEARQRAAQQTHQSLSLELEQLRMKLGSSEAKLDAYSRGPGLRAGSGQRRQSAAVPSLGTRLAAYSTLKREVEAGRHFYETMSQRVYDAGVARAVRQSDIRLIGPAKPAAHPYKPNLPLNLAIGAFGGLALAIGVVMLQEQTNSVLRAPGEAGIYLTLPELGAIPEVANGNLSPWRILGSNCGKPYVERAALQQPLSGLSEPFRATLASILSASTNGNGGHPHVLVVTSSRPAEGKTITVSNLGLALAEISNKVLLIDGDMRSPQLHKVFDQANSWGLSDILREKNAIEDLPLHALVKKTAVPHLHLLPSGTCTDNIFGLLCSGRMARLLPRFRQEFEYVLVDAPPCLEFADARIIARYAEKLLLVVRANYTSTRTVQAAVQRLLLDGIPVMGVILNRWAPSRSDIYGYAAYDGLTRQGLA